jgi:hypothetical protein
MGQGRVMTRLEMFVLSDDSSRYMFSNIPAAAAAMMLEAR